MDEKTLYTTGQVSGFTLTPEMSLYHYVRDFGEFFSDTARQHKRGRRWSAQDIDLIYSIQALYHKRAGKEKIRLQLATGWRLGDETLERPEAAEVISRLMQTCNEYKNAAESVKRTADNLADNLNRVYKRTVNDHQILENLQKAVLNNSREITEIKTKKHGLFG